MPKRPILPDVIFDTKRFVKTEFDSIDGMILICNQFGEFSPKRDMCRKWMERNAIPGDWLAVVIVARERETGKPVSLEPYLSVKDVF